MNENELQLVERDENFNPYNVTHWRRSGIEKMEKGDYEGAVDDFGMAIHLNSKHAKTYFNRGLCMTQLKYYKLAVFDFRTVLKLKPNMSDAWCELGRIAHFRMDHEKAIEFCTKAIKINSRHFEALVIRGYVKFLMKDYENSLIDLNRAFKINAFDAQSRVFRGFTHQALQHWEEALEDYDIAIALHPDCFAYMNRAVIKLELGKYREALADARKAIELDPEWNEGLAVLAEIEELGEGEEWKGV